LATNAAAKAINARIYNRRRPLSSLDGTTPDHAYFTSLPWQLNPG